MNRYILEKDKSEIYSSEENNNIELVQINQLEEKTIWYGLFLLEK